MSLLPLFISFAAQAAEVTDLPPQARGDVSIEYSVAVVPDALREGNQTVANRRSIDHILNYRFRLGALDYLALEVELPHHASSRLRFSDAHEMTYDPIAQTGTMIETGSIADSERHGMGLGGTWIRALATPVSETLFDARGDQITWLLGLGYQFKDQASFWNRNESGQRGAGPTSPAIEARSFWSTQNNMTSPFIGVTWTHRFASDTTLRNSNGVVTEANVELHDPSVLGLQTGMEIELWANESKANGLGSELALDLHGTFRYQTAGKAISGIYLPSVLSLSQNQTVTQSERSSLWAGGGVRWRIIRYLDWRIHSSVGSNFSHRLENPYDVSTAPKGTLGWTVGTAFQFRVRDPMFDAGQ